MIVVDVMRLFTEWIISFKDIEYFKVGGICRCCCNGKN